MFIIQIWQVPWGCVAPSLQHRLQNKIQWNKRLYVVHYHVKLSLFGIKWATRLFCIWLLAPTCCMINEILYLFLKGGLNELFAPQPLSVHLNWLPEIKYSNDHSTSNLTSRRRYSNDKLLIRTEPCDSKYFRLTETRKEVWSWRMHVIKYNQVHSLRMSNK